MPKKVLGDDPFTRTRAAGKPKTKVKKAEVGDKDEAEETSTGAVREKASFKRDSLLGPAPKPSGAAGRRKRVEGIRKGVRSVDDGVEDLLGEPDRTDEKEDFPAERSAARRKKKGGTGAGAEREYVTPEEESSTESDVELSDEDDEEGLLGQLAGMASLRKVGKLLGTMRLRTRSEDVDEFGKDPVYAERVEPLFEWLYEKYWRVDVDGIENVPDKGRALLVANHSGMLPFDGIMISEAVRLESQSRREVRFLVEDMFSALPFLAPFLARIGAARACQENAERLLERRELVCVFPEGVKGTGKHFRERYQLQRFGRGGFIKLCMRTKAPLVPVAVLGAEEIYPIIARFERLGKPFGLPYVPVTPAWPFLGPLGLIPLPSKWRIRFGKPVRFEKYGKGAAKDDVLVNKLKEQIRDRIQEMVDDMLKERKSVWYG